ncbi:MmcQ/YjbR family DNA-binding protein [Actinomadura barringtoniae]|uniref:MmcQ/YjbR family DNA-binding protein n=1 Tax=Actinomadura barringtoniae TaxID=1427535 RepID=A0A939PHA7_9ACTN|nr:MmcQ/YjbR family DNA-binding protein [Actinomadura barringtoniae]MBO2449759.1 MmcQ/YjbR family DNA-binding protein [Actinomadura barringtoniae]
MTPDDVSQHCLSLERTKEDYPFGPQPAVYRIEGKIFALLSEDEENPRVSLKLPPDEVEALKAQYPGTVLPGYHLNKKHWVTVVLDGDLDPGEVRGLIEEAYDVVVASLPRRLRPGYIPPAPTHTR